MSTLIGLSNGPPFIVREDASEVSRMIGLNQWAVFTGKNAKRITIQTKHITFFEEYNPA